MFSLDPDAADNRASETGSEPADAFLAEDEALLVYETEAALAADLLEEAPETVPVAGAPVAPARGKRARRGRRAGRRRPAASRWRSVKRALLLALLFLLGLITGVAAMCVAVLSLSGTEPPLATSPASLEGDLSLQLGPDYLAQLITTQIQTSGLPGQVSHLSVQLKHGAEMQIDGDDRLSTVMGVTITRHLRMNVQPYVSQCNLQVHVLSASLGDLSVTSLAGQFERRINQQLASEPSSFPAGFRYCARETHTEPEGLFITYTAQAQAGSAATRGPQQGLWRADGPAAA